MTWGSSYYTRPIPKHAVTAVVEAETNQNNMRQRAFGDDTKL